MSKKRVLIVDDSSATRFILSKMLRELNWEVEEACDGNVGLQKLTSTHDFDLALVDWNMPEKNGYELLQDIRRDTTFGVMKVVMVTTETEMSTVVKAMQAGADEYIMKPFTKEILSEKLRVVGFSG